MGLYSLIIFPRSKKGNIVVSAYTNGHRETENPILQRKVTNKEVRIFYIFKTRFWRETGILNPPVTQLTSDDPATDWSPTKPVMVT